MHADMRAELKTHKYRVYETLNFTIAGTTLNYADVKGGVIRNDAGIFLPGIISRGAIPRKLGWPSYGLSEARVTFRIYDEDRSIQELIGGPGQGEAKGSSIQLWWRSDNVSSANHFNVIDGIIKDFRMPAERTYEFVVGVNDAPLKSKLKIPRLTADIWPRIPNANLGVGSVYFGNWKSTGVPGANGMVQATLVNEDTGLWYVAYGVARDVFNIQVNGTADSDFKVLGSFFSTSVEIHAGRPYTVLQDLASPLRTTADTVTCDLVGPSKNGNFQATSSLVEPAFMLRIILSNFVYNDWPIDTISAFPWYGIGQDPNTPMNFNSNDTADTEFFEPYGIEASILVTSDDTGIGVIKTWAESFRCPVGWDIPFEIVTTPIKINERDVYPSEKITKFLRDSKKPTEQTKGSDVITAHRTTYIFNSADGNFVKQQIDGNRFSNEKVETDYEFTYGPAASVL